MTLGKEEAFVECHNIHSANGAPIGPKRILCVECVAGTRQRNLTGFQVCFLCRVLWPLHSAKALFVECHTIQSDQGPPLLFVFVITSEQAIYIYIYIIDMTYASQNHHMYDVSPTPHISQDHKVHKFFSQTSLSSSHASPTSTSFTNISITNAHKQ
jgi:hypothetical protein